MCLGIHRTWVNLIYVSRSREWFFTETLCLASNWKQRCPTKKWDDDGLNLATRKELLKISPYVLSTLGPGCSFCRGMATLLGGRKAIGSAAHWLWTKPSFPAVLFCPILTRYYQWQAFWVWEGTVQGPLYQKELIKQRRSTGMSHFPLFFMYQNNRESSWKTKSYQPRDWNCLVCHRLIGRIRRLSLLWSKGSSL